MANERNIKDGSDRNITTNNTERKSSVANDLPDSERDRKELEPEEVIMDLPDVKDIPGQEFVQVPRIGEMADTTMASDDEEGVNIIGLNDDDGDAEDDTSGAGGNITSDELKALADDSYMPTRDEDNLRRARMDSEDFEGTPLNEGSFGKRQTASDLDIPGSIDETRTDALGQGDEENKDYSLDDTDASEESENRTGV
ncbi:MAG: hypothetical protein M3Y85_12420 [Bacteroidota bacterium]|nr:hypothetical protein [Bacteroidota bacterium]